MSNARNLALLAQVTLGALATKSTVATADLQDGAVTVDKIGTGAVSTDKIAVDAVTAAKLGTNEKRQVVRAFGYVDGGTGTLVSGFGLTTTRTGTGAYTVTLTTAAPDLNFSVTVTPRIASNLDIVENSGAARTTTTTTLAARNTSTGSASDVPFFSVMVMW